MQHNHFMSCTIRSCCPDSTISHKKATEPIHAKEVSRKMRKLSLDRIGQILFAFLLTQAVFIHSQAPGTITPAPPDPTAHPPYGISAKRPLLAAACKGCPWGA